MIAFFCSAHFGFAEKTSFLCQSCTRDKRQGKKQRLETMTKEATLCWCSLVENKLRNARSALNTIWDGGAWQTRAPSLSKFYFTKNAKRSHASDA